MIEGAVDIAANLGLAITISLSDFMPSSSDLDFVEVGKTDRLNNGIRDFTSVGIMPIGPETANDCDVEVSTASGIIRMGYFKKY